MALSLALAQLARLRITAGRRRVIRPTATPRRQPAMARPSARAARRLVDGDTKHELHCNCTPTATTRMIIMMIMGIVMVMITKSDHGYYDDHDHGDCGGHDGSYSPRCPWHHERAADIWPGLEVYSYLENGRHGKEFPLLFHCVCIVVE